MSKPLLSSTPLFYCFGFHALCCQNCPEPHSAEGSLVLVHLHRIDHAHTKARHLSRARSKWNAMDILGGYSLHQLIVDGAEFDAFYYDAKTLGALQLIPKDIQSAL